MRFSWPVKVDAWPLRVGLVVCRNFTRSSERCQCDAAEIEDADGIAKSSTVVAIQIKPGDVH